MTTTQAIDQVLCNELDPAFTRRARLILSHLTPKPKMRVLDVGCGRGFYEHAVVTCFPGVSITGIDMSETYLQTARAAVPDRRATFQQADAQRLPFPDGSFDRVICSEVLEHVPDDRKVAAEILRVLKPGGWAMISVPHTAYPFFWDPLNFTLEHLAGVHVPSHIWWLAGIWADHTRLYTENQLKTVLHGAGFQLSRVWRSTSYCLPFVHFLLYAIGKNLVERGLVRGAVNRFSFANTSSPSVSFIRAPIDLFDRFNSDDTKGKRFLNIIVKAEKPL